MGTNNAEKSTIDYIKAYAFPGVLSILIMVVHNDIQEVKSDVKALLSQASSDRVKIEYLEKEVEKLRGKSAFYTKPTEDNDEEEPTLPTLYAVLPGKNDFSTSSTDPDRKL